MQELTRKMGERLRRRASTRVWMTGKLGFRCVEMYSGSSAPMDGDQEAGDQERVGAYVAYCLSPAKSTQ